MYYETQRMWGKIAEPFYDTKRLSGLGNVINIVSPPFVRPHSLAINKRLLTEKQIHTMAPHADNGNGLQDQTDPSMMAPLESGVPDAIAQGEMPRHAR